MISLGEVDGKGGDAGVNTVTQWQLKVWLPVSVRVLCLFTTLLMAVEPGTAVGCSGQGPSSTTPRAGLMVRLTVAFLPESLKGAGWSCRQVVVMVKDAGLELRSSARAGEGGGKRGQGAEQAGEGAATR